MSDPELTEEELRRIWQWHLEAGSHPLALAYHAVCVALGCVDEAVAYYEGEGEAELPSQAVYNTFMDHLESVADDAVGLRDSLGHQILTRVALDPTS